jgi:hypothetical protein
VPGTGAQQPQKPARAQQTAADTTEPSRAHHGHHDRRCATDRQTIPAASAADIAGTRRYCGVGALIRVRTRLQYTVLTVTPSRRSSTAALRSHVSNAAFEEW